MYNQRSQTKLATLLTALAFLFASQGCSKEDDPSTLGGAEISQNVAAPKPCTTVCLVAGKTMYVGTVGAAMAANGDLLVTYNVTKPGVFLLETHLDVFTSEEQLTDAGKVKNGNAAPGQFAFKQSFSLANQQREYTVTVTKAQLLFCGNSRGAVQRRNRLGRLVLHIPSRYRFLGLDDAVFRPQLGRIF